MIFMIGVLIGKKNSKKGENSMDEEIRICKNCSKFRKVDEQLGTCRVKILRGQVDKIKKPLDICDCGCFKQKLRVK